MFGEVPQIAVKRGDGRSEEEDEEEEEMGGGELHPRKSALVTHPFRSTRVFY